MHCPHCHAEPPRDPFICTACGERLLTYLDEPLGPGTGVRADELGSAAGARREPVGAAVANHVATDDRSWIARQIDPTPGAARRPSPDRPPAPRRDQPADVTGALVGKILVGLLVAGIVLIRWPLCGLLTLDVAALVMWRWPRMAFIPYAGALIAAGAALWVLVEIGDALSDSSPPFFPQPTPTIQRSFATSTPARPVGTPTVPPAQQTATAGPAESRVQVAHARARWLRGDYQTALKDLNQAVALAPGDANGLNLRALVKVALGDYAGAAADAQQAVARDSSATYHDTYGYALLKQGRYQLARDEYLKALTVFRGPDRAASQLGIGLAYVELDKLDDASTNIGGGLFLLPDVEPDPQLADLEAMARQAIPKLPPNSYSPTPAPSPAASPVALRAAGSLPGRAP